MNLDEVAQALNGDKKAAQFLVDNFTQVALVGSGPCSKVFKAHSNHFAPPQYYYAIRVLMPIQGLQEAEIRNLYRQLPVQVFVETFEVVRLQTCFI